MFKNLTDFGYVRSGKEALGFYLAYFVFAILASMVVSGLLGVLLPIKPDEAYYTGIRVGTFVALIISLTITYLIVVKKNLSNSLWYIILVLLAGLSAFFGGGLLGLIIPAILTTQGEKNSRSKTKSTKKTTKKKKK